MKLASLKKMLPGLIAGFALGLVFCLGLLVGHGVQWLGVTPQSSTTQTSLSEATLSDASLSEMMRSEQAPEPLRKLLLRADTAATGSTIAMATGPIDDDIEGLFVLDFKTGDLYCWVLGPNGGWMGEFKTNVVAEFGGIEKGKSPEYVMTTGMVRPGGNTGQGRPANTVCYVADANSGKVAAFSFMWDRSKATTGTPQVNVMTRIASAFTRSPNIERN